MIWSVLQKIILKEPLLQTRTDTRTQTRDLRLDIIYCGEQQKIRT